MRICWRVEFAAAITELCALRSPNGGYEAYRSGGGRGEKTGSSKACSGRICSSARSRNANVATAIKKHNVERMAYGWIAPLCVNAASNTNRTQNKAARRRTGEAARMPRSYAEELEEQ